MDFFKLINILFQNYLIIFYILFFIFGSIIGSFLSVCIYRMPRKISIVKPRSRCNKCENKINWYDNIPIISFIILSGRCRNCKEKISIIYPIVEILSGFFACACLFKFGLSIYFLVFYYFSCILIVVSFIDLEHRIIPDILSIPNIAIGIFLSIFLTHITWKESLIGAVLGFGILFVISFAYYFITKREGLGGGDVKLLAVVGAFLGYKAILPVIFLSSILGSIIGLTVMLIKKEGLRYAIPFGPFIAVGTIVMIFFYNLIFKILGMLKIFSV